MKKRKKRRVPKKSDITKRFRRLVLDALLEACDGVNGGVTRGQIVSKLIPKKNKSIDRADSLTIYALEGEKLSSSWDWRRGTVTKTVPHFDDWITNKVRYALNQLKKTGAIKVHRGRLHGNPHRYEPDVLHQLASV